MTPEELSGFADAMTQVIDDAVGVLRTEHAQALDVMRRDHEQQVADLVQRVERATASLVQVQRDLDAVRATAAQSPISAILVDGAGELHVVQRDGTKATANLDGVARRIEDNITTQADLLRTDLRAEIVAHVAREVMRLGSAPKWSRTAFYGEGAVVSHYVGRTYELREGVRASMAQEPGEHPEVWQRIGSHGLRVMKSKPAALEAGDVFTEAESKFISDGETTTLLVARSPKHSDIERGVRPAYALAQAAMDTATQARTLAEGHEPRLESVERTAANSSTWIVEEGDAAVLRSATTEAWAANRALLIDSPALARIVERADEIDTMLDQRQEGGS